MTAASKRGKAIDTDGPTPKFLYAILKQLDLKTVDWNLVASQLEISNGHAARMRYSRFRQQMEGTTGSRGSRSKKSLKKGQKGDPKGDLQKSNNNLMPSPMVFPKQELGNPSFQPNPFIKWEPYTPDFPNVSPYMLPEHSFLSYVPQYMPSSIPFHIAPPMPPQMSSSVTASEHSTMSPHPATEMYSAESGLPRFNSQPPVTSVLTTEPGPSTLSCPDEAPVKTEKENEGDTDDVIIKLEMPLHQGRDF